MAQKKSQVQNFEKVFDYTLFLGKYLPTFKCSSQNFTGVDTLIVFILITFTLVFLLPALHSYKILGNFPSNMALFGTTQLLEVINFSYQHVKSAFTLLSTA